MSSVIPWIAAEAEPTTTQTQLETTLSAEIEDGDLLVQPDSCGGQAEAGVAHGIAGQEVIDQEIIDQEIGDQEISDQEIGDQEISDQEIGDQEIGDQEVCDQEICVAEQDPLDRNPDLWLYRPRTVTMLRRYLRYSLETGRVPSILGSEFFRAKVTSYNVSSFEDRVVFAHDVELCLDRLDEFSRQVIARVILQEHDHFAAARLLHCSRSTIARTVVEALDRLSEIFLSLGLLVANPTACDVEDAQ